MRVPAFVFVFAFASAVLLGSAVDAQQLQQPARFEPLPVVPPGSVTWGPAVLVGSITSTSGTQSVVNGTGQQIVIFTCASGFGPPPPMPTGGSNCQPIVQQPGYGVNPGRPGSNTGTDIAPYALGPGATGIVIWSGTRTSPPMAIYIRTVTP